MNYEVWLTQDNVDERFLGEVETMDEAKAIVANSAKYKDKFRPVWTIITPTNAFLEIDPNDT